MLTCKEVTQLVTEYLEGRMPILQRASFQLHLGMCRHCRAYLRQMRTTIQTLGKLPPEPIPDAVRNELLARFRMMRWPADRAVAPPGTVAALEEWVGRRRGWVVVGVVLVAAAVIALLRGGQDGPTLGTWDMCVPMEIGVAAVPVLLVAISAVRAREAVSAGLLAAVAVLGAFAGYVVLGMTCPTAQVLPHVLLVHIGSLALAALLGAAVSRLPALR